MHDACVGRCAISPRPARCPSIHPITPTHLLTYPSHTPVNQHRYIEEKAGNHEEARRIFEQGIRQAPDHAPLFRVYGDFERRRGNAEQARRLYQTAIGIDPHYEQAYVVMGMLELSQGNVAGADDVVAASKAVFGQDYDFASQSDKLQGAFDRNELGEL